MWSTSCEAHWFWHDRLLLSAFAVCALLLSVRLWLILAWPTWSGSIIDWMRAAVAWPVLVQVRLIKHRPPRSEEASNGPSPLWRNILASLRLFAPLVVGLLVSTLIEIHAAHTAQVEGWHGEMAAIAVSFTLLVMVRQLEMCVDNTRLQREAEMTRANEQAQAELNRRKDEFLGVVAHE